MDKNWYIVRTFPGYEQKAAERLMRQVGIEGKQDVIEQTYIPYRKRYKFIRGKFSKKEEIMFPGYIFVKMVLSDDTFFFVRGIQHVTGYAGITTMKQKPSPMSETEYNQMIESEKEVIVEIDSKVRIVNHELLEGKEAHFLKIDPVNETVLVKYEEDEYQLNFEQIEKK